VIILNSLKIWQTTEHENSKKKPSNSDAVLLGWQATPYGKTRPLFNIMIKNHSLYHSTVTDETLRKYNLQVPQIPRAFKSELEGSDPLK
jgi:hypothetical protein